MKTIIDCDPGMDDALALLLGASAPELSLELVTAVAGNRHVETTTLNARRVLDHAGLASVPVVAGAARPIADNEARVNMVHGADGLGGADFGEGGLITPGFAPDALIDAIAGSDEPVDLVAIGPLTNLALAEIKCPGILKSTRHVLVMGGAAFSHGNATPAAEFNIYADPVAAHVVFSSGAQIVMFGLDVTRQALVTPAWEAALAETGTRSAEQIAVMFDYYAWDQFVLHDPCPVAWLLKPDLFDSIEAYVAVDVNSGPGQGKTHVWHGVVEEPPGPPNTVVITDVDQQGLLDLILAHYSGLP